jgi:transcriptional regulator with XRE-family HTH domain
MTRADGPPNPDVKLFLKRELKRRRKQNPNYSMRAFSSFFGVTHSYISKVLKGRRIISDSMLEKIGKRLGLDSKLMEQLKRALIESRQHRRKKRKFRN